MMSMLFAHSVHLINSAAYCLDALSPASQWKGILQTKLVQLLGVSGLTLGA